MSNYEYNKEYTLALMINGFSRGNSSVTQDFLDEDGENIIFSAKGTSLLIEGLLNGSLQSFGEKALLVGSFIKKKQGRSTRWEPTLKPLK